MNRFELSIPKAASLVLTHRMNGLFPGLNSVPASDRPPVKIVFFAFRIMLAVGFFMIAAALFGAFLWWRGTLFETRWYLRVMAQSWWVGFVGVISGWIVAECGRQPWIVQGIMRTADATSPVPGATIAGTLVLFVLAYGVVFWFGIYYINRLIVWGPSQGPAKTRPFSARPISAAQDAGREAMQR
jgi:cytochrome d ubiquinol oxidase subunit I